MFLIMLQWTSPTLVISSWDTFSLFSSVSIFFSLLSSNVIVSVVKSSSKIISWFDFKSSFIINFVDINLHWRIINKGFMIFDVILKIILNICNRTRSIKYLKFFIPFCIWKFKCIVLSFITSFIFYIHSRYWNLKIYIQQLSLLF